jgi:hypothetical protein
MIEIPIRQSWLNTLSNCPEWARQERLGLVTQKESSDMLRGNLVHSAIEHVGRLMILGEDPTFDLMLGVIDDQFEQTVDAVEVWREDHVRVIEVARNNAFAWFEEVRPLLDPIGVEEEFRFTLDERDGVRLVITGTTDWRNRDGSIWDWKNPSRKYEPWEKKRWDLQSHVYCAAFGSTVFNLVALVNGAVQRIEIERTEAHTEALKDLCWSAAELLQSDLKVWPKRWGWWGCSPKWCPVWQAGECRGKHLGSDPW